MNVEDYEKKRAQILEKKMEVDQRMISVKEGLVTARREFAATGKAASRNWLTEQETYLRRLGFASQELQRQLAEVKVEQRKFTESLSPFEHFLHEVLLEQMTREEVAEIFREARRRKNHHDRQAEMDKEKDG